MRTWSGAVYGCGWRGYPKSPRWKGTSQPICARSRSHPKPWRESALTSRRPRRTILQPVTRSGSACVSPFLRGSGGLDRLVSGDRKSVVEGKSVYVRVVLGGRRFIKQKTHAKSHKLI